MCSYNALHIKLPRVLSLFKPVVSTTLFLLWNLHPPSSQEFSGLPNPNRKKSVKDTYRNTFPKGHQLMILLNKTKPRKKISFRRLKYLK